MKEKEDIMMESKVEVGTLLYHDNHGMVRCVSIAIQKSKSDEKVMFYTLTPVKKSAGNSRFVATMAALNNSGFRTIVSEREAKQVLSYFVKGIVDAVPKRVVTKKGTGDVSENSLWQSAQALLSFAFESFDEKDRANCQRLESSATNLIEELSFALNVTREEVAKRVKKSLGGKKINPLVLTILEKYYEN